MEGYDPDGFDDFWFWLTTMTFSAATLLQLRPACQTGK